MNVFPYSIFKKIQRDKQSLTDVFAFAPLGRINITDRGSGHSGIAVTVSGNYFLALGIQADAGRLLAEGDDQASAPCAAAISYRFWQSAFGGDPTVPGRTITLNATPCTIVGVTPKDFQGLEYFGFISAPDVTIPMMQGEQIGRWEFGGKLPLLTADNRWGLQIMARLKPGVSEQRAQLEINRTFQEMLTPEWTSLEKEAGLPEIVLLSGSKGPNYMATFFAKPVSILMVVVTLLLMIACANIASLLLARGAARSREFTVRLALGCSRGRLIRQLVTESVILISLGGATGFLLAWWTGRYLVAFLPSSSFVNLGLNVSPDLRVLAFAAGISLFSGIVFGLGPAAQASRIELSDNLKGGNRSGLYASGKGRIWSRKLLVTFQLAVSFLLVVATGLMVRTLQNLKSADLGFDPRNVLVFSLAPSANGYTEEKLGPFYNRLLDRLNAIPGVVSASASSDVAMGGWNAIEVEGSPPAIQRKSTSINYVAPRFFETMGIPMLAGRGPEVGDTASRPKVAIINETFVRKYFQDTSPVGRRFRWKGGKDWIEVVGVVGDIKFSSVRAEPPPIAHIPFLQSPWMIDMTFEVRTAISTAPVAKEIYSAVHALDPNLPVIEMRSQEEQIDSSLSTERLFAKLAALFGALGLALACVGLYGIMAYNVTLRTSEIGIRMALGAKRADVVRLVVREGLVLTMIGVVIGFAGAFTLTRFLVGLLYGVRPTDTLTFVAVSLVLTCTSLLACYLPARRATKVDPMVALRYE
jgi:predicted permease